MVAIYLTREFCPQSWEKRIDELMESNVFSTREEAEEYLSSEPTYMDVFYEPGKGLWMCESECVEEGLVDSPFI